MANAAAIINGEFCLDKLWIALAISVAMNTIFAPVFMTFHKITDTHILDCGGSPRSLLTPIPMTRIITHLNWDAQWNLSSRKQFLSSGIRHTPSHSSCREKCGCCLQRYWVWCSGYCWLLRLGWNNPAYIFSNDFKQVLRIRYKELLYHFRILRYKGVGYHCDKGIQFCLPLLFSLWDGVADSPPEQESLVKIPLGVMTCSCL